MCQTASLPLMNNPSVKLAHNRKATLKIPNQQIKQLNLNIEDRKDDDDELFLWYG